VVSVRGELLAKGQLDDRLLAMPSEEGANSRKGNRLVQEQKADHVAILSEEAVEHQSDS